MLVVLSNDCSYRWFDQFYEIIAEIYDRVVFAINAPISKVPFGISVDEFIFQKQQVGKRAKQIGTISAFHKSIWHTDRTYSRSLKKKTDLTANSMFSTKTIAYKDWGSKVVFVPDSFWKSPYANLHLQLVEEIANWNAIRYKKLQSALVMPKTFIRHIRHSDIDIRV